MPLTTITFRLRRKETAEAKLASNSKSAAQETGTVESQEAATRKVASESTVAPSATPRSTAPASATRVASSDSPPVASDRIVTPLRPVAWEGAIGKIDQRFRPLYAWIPPALAAGFDIGIKPSFVFDPPSSIFRFSKFNEVEHFNLAAKYIGHELSMERIQGPFTQFELEQYLGGPFQASPLVIVQKPGSPKSRLVRDFSCDFDHSVPSINDLILSFVPPTPARTYWTKFNELKKLVWNALPGSMAMVIDAKEAFRQAPIIWHQRRFCIIEFCGRFYVDRCLPMGLTVATDLFGSLMDVYRLYTEQLFAVLRLVTTNQVDDILKLVQVWAMPKEDIRAAFFAVCEELGLVIADKEGGIVEFTSTPPFLGFILDFGVRRSISLKREKQIKYRDRVEAFVKNNCKADLEELESVTGYLAHAALVTTNGRAHLVSLYAWATTFEGNYFKSNYPRDPRIRSDLEWWLELLSRDEPITLHLHGSYELDPTNIVTDACLEGIGILVG